MSETALLQIFKSGTNSKYIPVTDQLVVNKLAVSIANYVKNNSSYYYLTDNELQYFLSRKTINITSNLINTNTAVVGIKINIDGQNIVFLIRFDNIAKVHMFKYKFNQILNNTISIQDEWKTIPYNHKNIIFDKCQNADNNYLWGLYCI